MHITRHSRMFLTVVGLVLSLILGLTLTQGLVLCIESDGQVAIESGVNGICSDEWEQLSVHTEKKAGSVIQDKQCDHCIDVPLTIISSKEYSLWENQSSTELPLIATQISNEWTEHLDNATSNHLPQPPPPSKPRIHTYLGTVILLN